MMNSDQVAVSARVASLEDIVRQQGQSVAALLQRLREVEQFAAADARGKEQLQAQLIQLKAEHTSLGENVTRLQQVIQVQSERIAELQSTAQGHQAGLRGTDEKYELGLRALEQRLQGEMAACHQRLHASDTASADAVRALQAQLQTQASSVQAVDDHAREATQAVQQLVASELGNVRQRVDLLESAMRDGLKAVHESLTEDLKSNATQLQVATQSALQDQQRGLLALEERTKAELVRIQQQNAASLTGLQYKLDETQQSLREALQAACNTLTSELAGVAQHSREVDSRHRTGHQTLVQELARHDQVMEGIDVNWRASVLDLNRKIDERVAAVQEKQHELTGHLTQLVGGCEARLGRVQEETKQRTEQLLQQMQQICVTPLHEVRLQVVQHDGQLQRTKDDVLAARSYVERFTHEIQASQAQLRQLTETAFRALHADLLERLEGVAGTVTAQPTAEELQGLLNEAMGKIWGEAASTFTTRQGLNTVQSQLALLEHAVRVELCALSEKVGGLTRSVEKEKVPQIPLGPVDAAATGTGSGVAGTLPASSAAVKAGTVSVADDTVALFARERDAARKEFNAIETRAQQCAADAAQSARTADLACTRALDALQDCRTLAAQTGRQPTAAEGDNPLGHFSIRSTTSRHAHRSTSEPSSSPLRRVQADTGAQEPVTVQARLRAADADVRPRQERPSTQPRRQRSVSLHLVRPHTAHSPAGAPPSRPSSELVELRDHVEAEIETIWTQLRGLPPMPPREEWVTRTEVHKLLADSKDDITTTVLDTVKMNQDQVTELLGAIKERVIDLAQNDSQSGNSRRPSDLPRLPGVQRAGAADAAADDIETGVAPFVAAPSLPLERLDMRPPALGVVSPGAARDALEPSVVLEEKSTSTLARDAAMLQSEVRHALGVLHLPPLPTAVTAPHAAAKPSSSPSLRHGGADAVVGDGQALSHPYRPLEVVSTELTVDTASSNLSRIPVSVTTPSSQTISSVAESDARCRQQWPQDALELPHVIRAPSVSSVVASPPPSTRQRGAASRGELSNVPRSWKRGPPSQGERRKSSSRVHRHKGPQSRPPHRESDASVSASDNADAELEGSHSGSHSPTSDDSSRASGGVSDAERGGKARTRRSSHRTSSTARRNGSPNGASSRHGSLRDRRGRRGSTARRERGSSQRKLADPASPLPRSRPRSPIAGVMARATSAKPHPSSSVTSTHVLHPSNVLSPIKVGSSAIRLFPHEKPVVLGNYSVHE